jgi:VIT1/CCC1 family predicted Fe2+/Mn2+ transporter
LLCFRIYSGSDDTLRGMKIPKVVPDVYPVPNNEVAAAAKLNWLRAAVLGANDGIISVAGLVVGIAGATSSSAIILATGVAGIVAGAISMAAGEYVSVSSQRDTEKAMLAKKRWELEHFPKEELQKLIGLYEAKGVTHETSEMVAHELTKHDAFAAHVDIELNLDPHNLTNPWSAAFASALSFLAGAIIPLITIMVTPTAFRIPATFIAVLIALVLTGAISARASGGHMGRATIRVLTGGAFAMAVTFAIGRLLGVSRF